MGLLASTPWRRRADARKFNFDSLLLVDFEYITVVDHSVSVGRMIDVGPLVGILDLPSVTLVEWVLLKAGDYGP